MKPATPTMTLQWQPVVGKQPWSSWPCGRLGDAHSGWWVREGVTGIQWAGVLCSPGSRAGNWLGGLEAQRWRSRQGRGLDGGEPSSAPVAPHRASPSLLHSAVASQLVPRGTWRHLVSVSTGAGTAEGCGRFSSTPVGPGAEAADARLQSETGGATAEWEEPD